MTFGWIPGDQDKATVEMECMEEGYLAKIIHGDGAKEIKVGEVHISRLKNKYFFDPYHCRYLYCTHNHIFF